MADTTTNRGWTIPTERSRPWYEQFLTLMGEVDSDVHDLFQQVYPSDNVIVVQHGATETINGTNLLNAYTAAKTMSPSSDKPILIIVPPGTYKLSSQLILDTNYINLQGFGIARRVGPVTGGEIITPHSHIYGAHGGEVIKISTNYLKLTSLHIEQRSSGINNVIIDSSSNAQYSEFHNIAFTATGTKAISLTVGVTNNTIQSKFYQCHADSAFMDSSGSITFSGEAVDCSGIDNSFAGDGGTLSGTCTRCLGGDDSFAGPSGTCTGKLYDCQGTADSIGTCSSATILKGFINTGRTAALSLNGFVEKCRFKGSIAPLINIAAGTKMFGSYIIASGEFSMAISGSGPVSIAGCFFNYDMNSNVVNNILQGYNVVSTNIDIEV